MGDAFEPQTLVRRFSEQIADDVEAGGSHSTVKTILAEDVRSTQRRELEEANARKWFEPWQPAGPEYVKKAPHTCQKTHNRREQLQFIHQKEAERLSEAWSLFRDKLPEEERVKIETRAPTFDEVIELMNSVAERWDKKRKKGTFGAICTWYRKCCTTLKAHETMLKILPESNDYCCLFVGVLKSVIYATANHEKIATDLARAISDISDIVQDCNEFREFYDTKTMQEGMMKVYAHIFKFLHNVLAWYLEKGGKRFVKAFNEGLYDEFQDQIETIRKAARSITEQGWKRGQAGETRVTRMIAENLQHMYMHDRETARFASEKERRRLAEEMPLRQAELAKQIAGLVCSQFEQLAERFLQGKNRMCLPDPGDRSPSVSPAGIRQQLEVGMEGQIFSRENILRYSVDLENFFDRARVRVLYDPVTVVVPSEAASPIQRWVTSKSSAILAISGPECRHSIDAAPMTKLAASIVDFARGAKLPVISYFCDINRRKSFPIGLSAQAVGAVGLVYSLLRQALEWLPDDIETSSDFSAEQFRLLNGSPKSLNAAIELLNAALQYMPPAVYCIIDGLQDLEERSTTEALNGLVKLLKRRTKSGIKKAGVFKVLITTSGRCRCLLRNLGREQMVLADEVSGAARQMRNGQPLML